MTDHAAAGICFFAYVSRPVFDGASDEQKIVSRLLFNYTPIIKDSIKVYCLQGYFMKRKVLVKSSEGGTALTMHMPSTGVLTQYQYSCS